MQEGIKPTMVEVRGVRFGYIALGGAALTEENLRAAIASAQEMADVVIALPAWGSDTDPFPDPTQLTLAQVAVDAGADLIVGSHSQIQAFGEVEGVPVFYGLGNFNGPEAAEGLMVRVYFRGTEFLGFELFPTLSEGAGTVRLADEEETAAILEALEKANEGLP